MAFALNNASTNLSNVDRRQLRAEAKAVRTKAVSAGADAGAVVPVQPRLRGLREDSISSAYLEEEHAGGGCFAGSG